MTVKPSKPSTLKVRHLTEGSLGRLKKAFDRAEDGTADQRELPCAECGVAVAIYRKPRGDWPLRCGDCRRRARLKSKRDTWHRYKETYRLKRGKSSHPRQKPAPAGPRGIAAPMRIPPRQIAARHIAGTATTGTATTGTATTGTGSNGTGNQLPTPEANIGPAVVWTPDGGHTDGGHTGTM